MSDHTLNRKIIRKRFYWSTLQSDCNDHVHRSDKCQIYAKSQMLPPRELYNMAAAWPFATWGIDIIWNILPKASNGHKFILGATDYFTKWVEVESFRTLNTKKVAQSIQRNIIYCYGVPYEIISDNGTYIQGSSQHSYRRYSIFRHKSSPYRP